MRAMRHTIPGRAVRQPGTPLPFVSGGRAWQVQASRPRAAASRSRDHAVRVRNQACLIVNTKGGGHAFIGYHLAKALRKGGHTVTILNDGDQAKLTKKAPYSKYSELSADGGVEVVWGDPKDTSVYPQGNFDVVYDNNGKDLETCQPLIDHFKDKVKHYVFVSSAGAYKANAIEPMHVEGDARKTSAGHVKVEHYLEESGLPWTVFQPLYIYGPLTAKDCEQWWIDRIVRDRPVPIPAPGMQCTSLTHVEDVADMLARVPGNDAAIKQTYNVCSDRCITFIGIATALAKALNKTPNMVIYDAEKLGFGKGAKVEGFPFRGIHFFASSDKAKRELNWSPKHDFLKDADELAKAYQEQGRATKKVDFSLDDKILAAVGNA